MSAAEPGGAGPVPQDLAPAAIQRAAEALAVLYLDEPEAAHAFIEDATVALRAAAGGSVEPDPPGDRCRSCGQVVEETPEDTEARVLADLPAAGSPVEPAPAVDPLTEACPRCSGEGCEEGCGRLPDGCEMAHAGPDSHRICSACGGWGRRLVENGDSE